MNKMVIPSDLKAARQVERTLLREVVRHGYTEAAVFAIKLALEEGLNNAIRHGNHFDPGKFVEIAYEVSNEKTCITIKDEGQGFDPDVVPDPTANENIEKPGGRGIMLMRAYMDEVSYNDRGNEVHIVKLNA